VKQTPIYELLTTDLLDELAAYIADRVSRLYAASGGAGAKWKMDRRALGHEGSPQLDLGSAEASHRRWS
jgi:hypothetical protein